MFVLDFIIFLFPTVWICTLLLAAVTFITLDLHYKFLESGIEFITVFIHYVGLSLIVITVFEQMRLLIVFVTDVGKTPLWMSYIDEMVTKYSETSTIIDNFVFFIITVCIVLYEKYRYLSALH